MVPDNLVWHKIADQYELASNFLQPNHVRSVKIEGKMYCIGRVGDAWYAINDTCPHAGASLGGGVCDIYGNVTCPHHRYKFSLKTGKNISGQGYYVDTFTLEIREDGLYIGLKKKKWWMF